MRWLQLDNIELTRPVGLERDCRILDVSVFDAVKLRAAFPVVLVGGEGPALLLVDAGDIERPVADVILGRLPPRVRVRIYDLLFDWIEDPKRGNRVEIWGWIGEINLEREVVDGRYAERRSSRFVLLRRVVLRVPFLVDCKPSKIGTANDLEKNATGTRPRSPGRKSAPPRTGSFPQLAESRRCTSAPPVSGM